MPEGPGHAVLRQHPQGRESPRSHGKRNRAQRATASLPAGPKAFSSQLCHPYSPQKLAVLPVWDRKAPGRAGWSELRAEPRWKDPTCLARGLLSAGKDGSVAAGLHRPSQAVVSTFLATFHQHT